MKTFTLKILAADKTFYEGDCEIINFSAADGRIGIEANHEDSIISVVPGEVDFRIPGEKENRHCVCSLGILKFENNTALLLCDTCEKPEDIDEARAKKALERAKEELKIKQNRQEYMKATAEVNRAMARLKVKKKYKKY